MKKNPPELASTGMKEKSTFIAAETRQTYKGKVQL
jgi:hypothetical protein